MEDRGSAGRWDLGWQKLAESRKTRRVWVEQRLDRTSILGLSVLVAVEQRCPSSATQLSSDSIHPHDHRPRYIDDKRPSSPPTSGIEE